MTPDDHTIQEVMLNVDGGHQIYVHDWGNKQAKSVIVYLHGGPGSSCHDSAKALFDPTQQRVIFHDQRGCGRSLPYGSLKNNTTQALIGDITAITQELGVETFVLAGGSWGSFLSLAYAIAQPKKVTAMVLRGIFTGASDEQAWMDEGHFKTLFPDIWERYLGTIPADQQDNPTAYYYDKVMNGNVEERKQAAYQYDSMEYALLSLDDRPKHTNYETYDPTGVITEVYYLAGNNCFVPDKYILDNASKLTMPIYLVQGRYDMVCPPFGAYRLHQTLANSQLIWTIAGHHGSDRANFDAVKSLLLQFAGEK